VPDGTTSSSATIKPVDQSKRSLAWGDTHPSEPCSARNLVLVKSAEYSYATFVARVEEMDPARQQWLISHLAPLYGSDKPLAELLVIACSDQVYHLNGGHRPACSDGTPAWSVFADEGFQHARALRSELCELPKRIRKLQQDINDAKGAASAARLDEALHQLRDAWDNVAPRAKLRPFWQVVATAQHTSASAVREQGAQGVWWLDVSQVPWPPLLPPQLLAPPALVLGISLEGAIVEIVKAAMAAYGHRLAHMPSEDSGNLRRAINEVCDKHAARTAAVVRKEEATRRRDELEDRLRWVKEQLPSRYLDLPHISVSGFERRKDVYLVPDAAEIDGYKPFTPDAFARHFDGWEARLKERQAHMPSPLPAALEEDDEEEEEPPQKWRHYFEDDPYGLSYSTKATQVIQVCTACTSAHACMQML
jgi:hypothetical protein